MTTLADYFELSADGNPRNVHLALTDAHLHVLGWQCLCRCHECGALVDKRDVELHAKDHDDMAAVLAELLKAVGHPLRTAAAVAVPPAPADAIAAPVASSSSAGGGCGPHLPAFSDGGQFQ